jgi:hypothetical protein
MISQLFKRRKPPQTPESAPDIRSQRPRAGELRVRGLNETLFLAPLPVYTGQAQVSRRNFSAMNETYLELGGEQLRDGGAGEKIGVHALDAYVCSFYSSKYIHPIWGAFLSRKFQEPIARTVRVL